ncbi:MAG: hypothetical protein ACOVQ7_22480 [Limnoraphis robusta]
MQLVNSFYTFISVLWQNSFFHVCTLILFIIAVWGEHRFVRQYQRYLKAKSQITQEAITYLSLQLERQPEGRIELKSTEIFHSNWGLLLDWFSSYLIGEISYQGNTYETEIKGRKFLLFQYPAFLTRSIPRSQWQFVPSLLIAIGVLGTFYGIQSGLQDISLGNLENTTELLPSIRLLLEGMKTAFSTSLMGLGSASLMTLVLAWGERKRQNFRDNLREKLDQISQIKLSNSANSQGNLNIAEIMKTGFAQLIEAQNRVDSHAIGTQVGLAMTPIFQDIREELTTLKQIKADQGEAILNHLLRELRIQVIEPVVERLDQSAQLTQEASQAVRELKNELGGISASLAQSILTIQSFQEDTLAQLQAFAGSLQTILGEFQSDTQGVLQQVSLEIRSGVAESIEGMKAQRIAFQASAEDAANTFRGIQENLQFALRTQAEQEQQMLEQVQQRMTKILTATHNAFQTQSHTIKAVGEEASQLMNQAQENLVGSLQNVDTMLQNTRLMVQEELERFRIGYQVSLQHFFEEQNNLLEGTLGKQQKGLAQVVVALQRVFQEESEKRQLMSQQVDESMAIVLKTAKEVSEYANYVGLNASDRMAQLQELAKITAEEVKRVETVYDKLVEQLNTEGQRLENTYTNLVEQLHISLQAEQEQVQQVESVYQNLVSQFNLALESGNQQLIHYLEQASASQNKFFTDADSSMAKVCQGLQASSDGLMQVAQYLVASADNLSLKQTKN